MSISKQYLAEVRLKREEVKSFDVYPFSLAAVRPLETLELHPAACKGSARFLSSNVTVVKVRYLAL